jgi:hypothetical protein
MDGRLGDETTRRMARSKEEGEHVELWVIGPGDEKTSRRERARRVINDRLWKRPYQGGRMCRMFRIVDDRLGE